MSETSIEQDLDTARYLAECGVPIFLARPAPRTSAGELDYEFPRGWQNVEPDPRVLDDWKPGMAVCAVMGHTVDGVDKDPRAGGELPTDLQPKVYGRQNTPSGGTHDLVAPLGVSSKNGVLPGIDVKAGLPDRSGRGFLFLAPTVRTSKEDGQDRAYTWETRPNLDELMLIGGDSSGLALANLVGQPRSSDSRVPSYTGLPYDQLPEGQKHQADAYQAERLEYWQTQLDEAKDWPEGQRDHRGRGWEELTRDFAWAIASYAVCPWMPLTEASAHGLYDSMLPEVIAKDPKCRRKWYEGLLDKASENIVELPPWTDFSPIASTTSKSLNLPDRLEEVYIAEWLAKSGVGVDLASTSSLGWLKWDGRRWAPVKEDYVRSKVVQAIKLAWVRAEDAGLDQKIIKGLRGYLADSKIRAVTSLMRAITTPEQENYDAHPHLLNVGNGVVDLRTGDLLPHNPDYKLTKITNIDYEPGFTDPDWDQVLSALDPEVMDWMQLRFGQGATGFATSDDVLPISQGGGSNGKTTLITVIRRALQEHAVTVPDKILMPNPGDHSTELTPLMGARLAFIDETPEARHLNIGRLKTLMGSTEITARKIAKDPVTWFTTHSLFLMTNYLPQVAENDVGTRRRLALVKFDKKFKRDDGFRARVSEPDSPAIRACLAWVIEGAKLWYEKGKSIPDAPEKVRKDTDEWLNESDPTNDYIESRFVLDSGSSVLVSEVTEDINGWLMMNSMKSWSRALASSRLPNSDLFSRHGITITIARKTAALESRLDKRFDSEVPSKARVFHGIRWRRADEPIGFDPSEAAVPDTIEELV